jgi:hypothetical protein
MDPSTWPAIVEPVGSVTFDLSPVFDRDARGFAVDEAAINQLALDAFTEIWPAETKLIALDWQHPATGSGPIGKLN